MITGKNHIGFDLSALGKKTFQTLNPATNMENKWVFYEATDAEVDAAVEKAKGAFSIYRNFSGEKRAEFLRAIAEEIESLGDTLIATYTIESGLPEGRARGERGRTMNQLRLFADLSADGSWVRATIDKAIPDREPVPKPDIRKLHIPLGPVAVFGSSNFPLAFSTAGGDTASALAAGCPVVVKSHPMHTATGELVATAVNRAAKKTGMPDGVFSNLNSSGIEVGQFLVKHPGIKAVGFTGSITGGIALQKLAMQRKEPIPVFAEMGSINPVLILPSALKEHAKKWADAYAGSITLGAGQFCTNPGLLLGVEGEELDTFIEVLAANLADIEPGSMLHPTIRSSYTSGSGSMSGQEGVSVVLELAETDMENAGKPSLVKVPASHFLKNPTLHKEVFGPFAMVVISRNEKELLEVIRSLEGQLTGTVLSKREELQEYSEQIQELRSKVGRLIFNGVPTGVEVCPAMQHGGPYPATTDSRFTSVGTHAIDRWIRPMAYQDWPDKSLPKALQNANPLGIWRLVDNSLTREPIKLK